MPRFQSDSDARRLGEALAALRRLRALSQAEAGRRAGMTSQGWGLYETGKRSGLYRPDVQRRLTAALEATPDDLLLQQETPGPGMASDGQAFVHVPAATHQLQISNDDLAPWADSGVVVAYEPDRWPRRGQGCVIEMTNGEVRVRLYEAADAQTLTVRGGPGGLTAHQRIARSDTRAVHAVVARLDAE